MPDKATLPNDVQAEYDKLLSASYATDEERILAARVNAAKPKPVPPAEIPVQLTEENGKYWPQRFPKHPDEIPEVDGYSVGDQIFCFQADKTFFVLPADAKIVDARIIYPDGRNWIFPRAALIDVVEKRATVEMQECEYCGGSYPAPIELHHTEQECDEASAKNEAG